MQSCYIPLAKTLGAYLTNPAAQQGENFPSVNTVNGRQVVSLPTAQRASVGNSESPHRLHRQFCQAIANLKVASLEQVQCFIDRGVNLNKSTTLGDIREGQPLHWAAIAGNWMAMEALIASGQLVDIDATYGEGFTALSLLCGAKSQQIKLPYDTAPAFKDRDSEEIARNESLRTLLHAGADPDLRDARQRTALHHAAKNNRPELIMILLSSTSNIDINARDSHGDTPLHKAASMGHHASVLSLLKFGADATATNNLGESPLHRLALCAPFNNLHQRTNAIETARSLLDYGAQPRRSDQRSKRKPANTPIGHAERLQKHSLAHAMLGYPGHVVEKQELPAVHHVQQTAVALSQQPQATQQRQASNPMSAHPSLLLPD